MNKTPLYASTLLFFLFCFLGVNAASYETSSFDKKIIVTGNGKVTANPDYAIYKINFKVTDEDIAIVKLKQKKLHDELMTTIKNIGIDEKDISVSVRAEVLPSNNYNVSEAGKFSVSKSIYITVRDLKAVEKLTITIIKYKNIVFEGIEYHLNNTDELYNQAMKMAIQNGKEDAQKLATQTGLVLGKISGIQRVSQYIGTNQYYNYNSHNSSYNSGQAAKQIATAPGKITVSSTINLSFDISQGSQTVEPPKSATPAPTTTAPQGVYTK